LRKNWTHVDFIPANVVATYVGVRPSDENTNNLAKNIGVAITITETEDAPTVNKQEIEGFVTNEVSHANEQEVEPQQPHEENN
jgi:hypothetical protein